MRYVQRSIRQLWEKNINSPIEILSADHRLSLWLCLTTRSVCEGRSAWTAGCPATPCCWSAGPAAQCPGFSGSPKVLRACPSRPLTPEYPSLCSGISHAGTRALAPARTSLCVWSSSASGMSIFRFHPRRATAVWPAAATSACPSPVSYRSPCFCTAALSPPETASGAANKSEPPNNRYMTTDRWPFCMIIDTRLSDTHVQNTSDCEHNTERL